MLSQTSRQEVLSGLGLRSWYCKYTLPNAAQTPAKIYTQLGSELDMLVESDSGSPAAPVLNILETVEVKNKPKADSKVQAKLSNSLDDEGRVIVESPQLVIEPTSEKGSISGLLLTMAVFDKIVVLYESSVSSEGGLEKKLLENIISVMEKKTPHPCGRESVFSWPVFESNAFISEQSRYFEAVARRWLEGQSWSECAHILYFGNSYSVVESILSGIKTDQGFKYNVVSFPDSLFHLLHSPIKKKNLWDLISRSSVLCG